MTQEPFEIDVTFLTSEILGKYILGKLETSRCLITPIPNELMVCNKAQTCEIDCADKKPHKKEMACEVECDWHGKCVKVVNNAT